MPPVRAVPVVPVTMSGFLLARCLSVHAVARISRVPAQPNPMESFLGRQSGKEMGLSIAMGVPQYGWLMREKGWKKDENPCFRKAPNDVGY